MPIRDTAKRADLPVWRSLLYVPTNVPKYVDKAHTRGADAIQLDLEDSVPNSQKAEARKLVQEAAEIVSQDGADVVVRINHRYAMRSPTSRPVSRPASLPWLCRNATAPDIFSSLQKWSRSSRKNAGWYPATRSSWRW